MTATAKTGHMDARIRARRARVRADAAKRRQRRTLSLFVLLVLVAGVAVALRSPLFEISGVEVTGTADRRAGTVRRTAALEPGQHLLTAPLAQAQRRVEALPWVATAVVRRSPPSTVAIEVTPRTPLLTVRTDVASWKIDDAAVLVDGGKVADAPVLQLGSVALPELGEVIDIPVVRDAVEVHTHLRPWLRRQVEAYETMGPSDLVLRLKVPAQGDDDAAATIVRVRFGTAKDLALKTEVIRVLLPQAVERGGALDIRAPANPVVVPAL
ncbi:hypothetical protein BH23ACT10_BH23ACT10_20160 [soil metagenome]